jgi:hypothetical protein
VSQFFLEPHDDHMVALKHILLYVARTVNWGLHLKGGSGTTALVGFTNSDFKGDVDSRKSTSGVFFFLNKSPITWQSTKQSMASQSSCEVEYVAATNGTCQALWHSRVLGELEGGEVVVPALMVDNQPVVTLIKNLVLSGRSKHIEVKYHLVWESADQGKIDVKQVRTDN